MEVFLRPSDLLGRQRTDTPAISNEQEGFVDSSNDVSLTGQRLATANERTERLALSGPPSFSKRALTNDDFGNGNKESRPGCSIRPYVSSLGGLTSNTDSPRVLPLSFRSRFLGSSITHLYMRLGHQVESFLQACSEHTLINPSIASQLQ